jgi:hypothetical protein
MPELLVVALVSVSPALVSGAPAAPKAGASAGVPRAPATQPSTKPADFAALTRALNDFTQWQSKKGAWQRTADGRIRGDGDSSLLFPHDLPREFLLRLRLRVLTGMRPRVRFGDKGVYFGNEGADKALYAHGGKATRGVSAPYANGKEIELGLRFRGDQFEFLVNGQRYAQGQRGDNGPFRLTLRAGDDWSPGSAEFWDLTLTPP